MAAVAALAMGTGAASAATIVNGSFEDTAFNGSWKVFQGSDVNGWEVESGAGVEIQTNSVGSVLDTLWGNQYVELDSHNGNGGASTGTTNSTIGQTVSLLANTTYEVSFQYSPRVNDRDDRRTNKIRYMVEDSLGARLINSAITGPSRNAPYGIWTEVTYRFETGAAGDYTLLFSARGDDDTYGGLLDNVTLSQVPLPAGLLMMLTALGGLGLARRRS